MFDGPLSISIHGLMAKVPHIHPYSTIFLSRLVSHMFPCKHLGAQSPPIHCRFWWKFGNDMTTIRLSFFCGFKYVQKLQELVRAHHLPSVNFAKVFQPASKTGLSAVGHATRGTEDLHLDPSPFWFQLGQNNENWNLWPVKEGFFLLKMS
jgi:hypothetical protein